MENKINWWKVGGLIVAGLLLFGLGFYLGWKREPEVIVKTEVEYVELPPIHDTLYRPKPYKVVEPIDTANLIKQCVRDGIYAELFPERKDTVYITKSDTTAIIADWASVREYKETLFDCDTLGRFSFDATIQYNRMTNFEYDYAPVQRQETITVKTKRKFLPYIGAGVDIGGSAIGQGGMFINQDAGFAVQYRYDIKRKENTVGAMFLYMF